MFASKVWPESLKPALDHAQSLHSGLLLAEIPGHMACVRGIASRQRAVQGAKAQEFSLVYFLT